MRVKKRYIAAALTVAASIAATPLCVDAANAMRGYKAYGGEYLIIPLGIALAVVILDAAKAWDGVKKKRKERRRSKAEVVNSVLHFNLTEGRE